MARKRVVDAKAQKEDATPTARGRSPLRPLRFDDYIGQRDLVEKLSITLDAVEPGREARDARKTADDMPTNRALVATMLTISSISVSPDGCRAVRRGFIFSAGVHLIGGSPSRLPRRRRWSAGIRLIRR